MAIAITPFSGFCGFLPPKDIAIYLTKAPEFASLISPDTISFFQSVASNKSIPLSSSASIDDDPIKVAIREVFGAVMKSSTDSVKKTVAALISRYTSGNATPEEADIKDLAITLDHQFPGDVGVLCVFLLNVVKLDVGQAVFLKADEPHAYISGDIIETMATSDNVVRAGLTPKLRDVPTLLSMLTYTYEPASKQLMVPQPYRNSRYTTLYDPPIEEFAVLLTQLGPEEEEVHQAIDGPSILIVTSGRGFVQWGEESKHSQTFQKDGEVFFIGAGTELHFKSDASQLVMYRAFVEVPTGV